jgi:hypothetical protein
VVAAGDVPADVVAELAEAVVLVGDPSRQLIHPHRPTGRPYPGRVATAGPSEVHTADGGHAVAAFHRPMKIKNFTAGIRTWAEPRSSPSTSVTAGKPTGNLNGACQ